MKFRIIVPKPDAEILARCVVGGILFALYCLMVTQ